MQTATSTTNSFPTIPLALIEAGNNPRKFFDDTEMSELIGSVRSVGIIQPITVRPISTGRFQIIAGERRFRAACEVFGLEEGVIPAVVREADDALVDEMSLIENIQRSSMSVTEEAVAASKVLERNNGDREEASKVLGWPVSKLNRRLALLNLCEAGITALNERKIQVGHAELLATVEQAKQADALAKIIEHNLTVQFVKDNLIKSSKELSKAIFDTVANCSACQSNSEIQSSLFDNTVGSGKCTNGTCFSAKTAEKIESIKNELLDEVVTCKVLNIGDTSGFVALSADGGLGVGVEQYEACRACQNFGATISAIPGSEGQIDRSICFDTACHQKKVVAAIKEAKEDAEAAKSSTGSTPKDKKEKKASAPKSVELPQKMKEFRRKVWNTALIEEFKQDAMKAHTFILDLMLSGHGSKVSSTILVDAYKELTGQQYAKFTETGSPAEIFALGREQKMAMFSAAAGAAVSSIDEKRVRLLLDFLAVDLTKYFIINKDYLDLLTKSEIEALATEAGFDTLADFKKIMGGKKGEVISGIIESGFDFNGIVPSTIKYSTPAVAETAVTE